MNSLQAKIIIPKLNMYIILKVPWKKINIENKIELKKKKEEENKIE